MIKLLQEENDLMEIVKLVGADLMPEDQKLILEIGRVIRAGFLQQNAFHEVDTFVPLEKQYAMMSLILFLYDRCVELTRMGVPVSVIKDTNFLTTVFPENTPSEIRIFLKSTGFARSLIKESGSCRGRIATSKSRSSKPPVLTEKYKPIFQIWTNAKKEVL